MPRKKLRHPFAACAPPNQFEQAQQEQCFATRQKKRCDHVAWPMCTEINSRITNGQGDEPVKPAPASAKQRAKNGNHTVRSSVSRGKRWSRPVSLGGIAK